MKTQIAKMKLELKELARQIRTLKSHRKDRQVDGTPGSGYVSGLVEASRAYRHKHVAYCLVRGKKLEQCDSGYKLDMKLVDWVISSMTKEREQFHKLYVVVNKNLTPSQQAVQSGHAVASFLRKYPNTQWSNGFLIYLKDEPGTWPKEQAGNMMPHWSLKYGMNHYAEFIEPDLNNTVTAYAVFGPEAEIAMKNKVLL